LEIVKAKNAKAILVCGSYDESVVKRLERDFPIAGVISLNDSGLSKAEQISRAEEILYDRVMKELKLEWFRA